jgi:hypothetical protein
MIIFLKIFLEEEYEPLYFQVLVIFIAIVIYIIRDFQKKRQNKTSLTKFKIIVAVGIISFILLMFAFDYKIPWFDKHPDWKEFPSLTNKKIVIEEIKNFDKLYGNKYKIPELEVVSDEYNFERCYRKNLKNIKSIGYRVTGNEFEYYGFLSFSGLRDSGNSIGSSNNSDFVGASFSQNGYEYLEFTLYNQKGYFKAKKISTNTELESFYQYNYPQKENDTLFFNYVGVKYRAYIKK